MITLPISLSVSYSFCSLNSALKRNTPVPAKRGRKPLMSDEMLQQLAANVTNAATSGRSKVNKKREIQEVIAIHESNISFIDANNVHIHRNTVAKISKQANVTSVIGDVKNSARMEGRDN